MQKLDQKDIPIANARFRSLFAIAKRVGFLFLPLH